MPNSTINSIKNAFAHFSASDILAGFKDIGSIAGQLISSGLFVINILSVLNNKKLKPTQKILPLIGYSLAIIASTAVAIILIAGMTALIPPFIFTASCVAVFNGMTTYLEARAERNVLRKELISSLSFQEYVAKKIPLKHHPDVLKYSYLPQEIYKLFYELRDKIKQIDIPLLEKK